MVTNISFDKSWCMVQDCGFRCRVRVTNLHFVRLVPSDKADHARVALCHCPTRLCHRCQVFRLRRQKVVSHTGPTIRHPIGGRLHCSLFCPHHHHGPHRHHCPHCQLSPPRVLRVGCLQPFPDQVCSPRSRVYRRNSPKVHPRVEWR